ncbi:hypothetical protein B9Z19DRAFT_1076263 [Tuber borchii]|uniref:C2H2-type domain-containing protein n=1 Tax=Tuber borchii TaxID=42251 RepID=A0A2T7A290_TUBBO|nr:hypothetical protein B9Z19DRAFT_1076263 [Tuber borchii]
MASQFSSTNGTDIKTSAAPAGASKNLPPLSTKPSTLTPQAQLTGAAALNRQRSTSPKLMPEEHKNHTTTTATATTATTNDPPKQSPNPAALLTAGFGMSTPADAPKEATPSRELGSLPGVAAAAAAMEERESPTATPMSGKDSAGFTTTAPPDTASLMLPEQYPPLQPQPPTPQQPQMQPHPKDTGTPVTPGFPNPTTPVTPFSPSSSSAGARGKHTCQHCMKTFTRHHNLKSHLLTHAHEKPYLCTTCQARFRRLHDLKRHSKLHTGERPHVCNKCGRRFARGDALARHARGEGGCAGRRGSMSGLNEDGSMSVGGEHEDEIGDLEGLMDQDGDVDMDDVGSPAGASGNVTAAGGRRRQSLPSLRTDIPPNASTTSASAYTGTTTATPLNLNSSTSTASSSVTLASRHHHHHHHQHHHPHHNNTYPPPSGGRSLVTAPPTTNPQSTTSTTSSSAPGQAALSASTPSPSLFTPGISFNRTPAPVTTSTPSTTTTATTATTATAANNTILSPAGVLTDSPGAVSPGMTRERTPSFTSSGGFLSPPGPVVAGSGTAGGRTSGAGVVGGGAGSSNVFASGMDGVWAYIRNLEDRVRVLEERAGGRE